MKNNYCWVTVYSKLNTKIKILENKITDAYILIRTNQYNTDKHSFGKKIGDL